MNKWYRSAPCKGILVMLAHLCVIVLVICGVAALTSPGFSYFRTSSEGKGLKYEESATFGADVTSDAHEILAYLIQKNNLETDGVYNPDKIVDIKDYSEHARVSGADVNGISYTVRELINVSEQLKKSNGNGPQVIVCQREDGTYDYFMAEAFEAMIKGGKFYITTNDFYMTASELYTDLEGGHISRTLGESISLVDETGTMAYKGCWNLWGNSGYIEMQGIITSDAAQKIIKIAGTDASWNGKLFEALEMLGATAVDIEKQVAYYQQRSETWSEGNTNLTYLFGDLERQKVYTNRAVYEKFEELTGSVEQIAAQGKYIVAAPKLADFHTNMDTEARDWKEGLAGYTSQLDTKDYIFAVSVDTTYSIQDSYYSQNKAYTAYAPWFGVVWMSAAIALLLLLIVVIWLTIVAGRTRNGEDVSLNFFDRIKTEIALIIVGLACVSLFIANMEWASYSIRWQNFSLENYIIEVIALVLWTIGLFAAGLTGYLSLVRRLKAHMLWKNSCLRWLLNLMRELIRHRKSTTKIILLFAGLAFLQMLLITTDGNGFFALLTFVVGFVLFVYAMRAAMAKQRIKDGIERIANGEVDYQIPLEGLSGGNLDMAVRINNIGEGLNKAMEESLKSERLKTDLITNVSHDIKTPLTSIINYVDILKRENFQDPKIRGYLDILEAKAQRLKHLTEDVVEASKISSGNISLEFVNLNLVEMINQTNGEFAEKFATKNLEMIKKLPDVPAVIHADGRRMWRVLENIYNNAAKYAMEGTRIYADLVVKARTIEFSLKNISQYPLNISADELTERFIRGDVSRSTEGSGLGLSIAKNLTTIQGGTFQLYLDGDLFKVTIIFPKVYQKLEKEQPIKRESEEPNAND